MNQQQPSNFKNDKAILFDLEGILADTQDLHYNAHKKALSHYGINFSFEEYVENGANISSKILYPKLSRDHGINIDIEKARSLRKEYYKKEIRNVKLMEGAIEILEKLKSKFTMGLVSGAHGNEVDYIVDKLNLGKYFKFVINGDEVPKSKPAPDVYLKALDILKIEPNKCVAIEDASDGVMSAKDAGIKCIAIPNRYTKVQDFSRANLVINNINELNEDIINNV